MQYYIVRKYYKGEALDGWLNCDSEGDFIATTLEKAAAHFEVEAETGIEVDLIDTKAGTCKNSTDDVEEFIRERDEQAAYEADLDYRHERAQGSPSVFL